MAMYYRETTVSFSDEPMFVISVAARLVEMHPQTLRYYERAGLIKPKRSSGSIRLYSQQDIERLKKIARLVDDLGVNLAGVEVIINLTEKLELMQNLLEQNSIELPDGTADVQGTGTTHEQDAEVAEPDAAPAAVKIKVRRPRSATKAQTKSKKE